MGGYKKVLVSRVREESQEGSSESKTTTVIHTHRITWASPCFYCAVHNQRLLQTVGYGNSGQEKLDPFLIRALTETTVSVCWMNNLPMKKFQISRAARVLARNWKIPDLARSASSCEKLATLRRAQPQFLREITWKSGEATIC